MGWFGVAALLGALLWGLWYVTGPHDADAQARTVVGSIVVLVAGLVGWAALYEQTIHPGRILDAISHGRIGRFMLGLAVGYIIAFALHAGFIAGLNFLVLAAAAAILALAAPHLDWWLFRISSIKTAFVELQFTSNATHKVGVAERINVFAAEGVFFESLPAYGDRIQSDVRYVQLIELPELENKRGFTKQQDDYQELLKFVEQAEAIKTVFKELISDLADCYAKISRNSHHFQEILRPLARDVQQLVHNRGHPQFKGEAEEQTHKRFWEGLLKSAWELDKSRVDWGKSCSDITQKYARKHRDISTGRKAYPRISEYGKLPYLYYGAATFLMAVGEPDAALKLLEHAEKEIEKEHTNSKVGAHIDYAFLVRYAQAKYLQGRPAVHTAELYETIMRTAVARRTRLSQHCKLMACTASKKSEIEELEKRHRAAEIYAMNAFIYDISEDLARDIDTAKVFESKMEQYTDSLKIVLDSKELHAVNLGPEEDNYLDTYAYARLVIEARKPFPDIGVFRRMRRLLGEVVARLESEAAKNPSRDAFRLLNATRIHYQSARELAGG